MMAPRPRRVEQTVQRLNELAISEPSQGLMLVLPSLMVPLLVLTLLQSCNSLRMIQSSESPGETSSCPSIAPPAHPPRQIHPSVLSPSPTLLSLASPTSMSLSFSSSPRLPKAKSCPYTLPKLSSCVRLENS